MRDTLLIGLTVIALTVGCATSRQGSTEYEPAAEEESEVSESVPEPAYTPPELGRDRESAPRDVPPLAQPPVVSPLARTPYYRIQVLASSRQESADRVKTIVQQHRFEDVEVLYEDNLWKVHVGYFPERLIAEKTRDQLRGLGWYDAWIVEQLKPQPVRDYQGVSSSPEGEQFSIQMLATGTRDEARKLLRNLLALGFTDTYMTFDAQLWKVRVGPYSTRDDAESRLAKVRALGFTDAWIIRDAKIQ